MKKLKKDNLLSNLISYFFLIYFILILIYIFYKSEIVYNGLKSDFYLKYYLATITLIIFSAISFLLKKELKFKILLVFALIIFSLYSVELCLSLYTISKYNEKSYKLNKDKRTKYQVYRDLINSGKKVELVIPPLLFLSGNKNVNPLGAKGTINNENEIFPFSGISNATTLHCREGDYWSIYKSDRYGFNNPDKEWNKSHVDFVFVGDSFTQGACVNESDTFPGQIRSKKSINGVLNLAYGGHGSLMEFATLKEYLPYIKTKNVIWVFAEGNSLISLSKEISNNILIKYLEKEFNQNLIKRQNEIDHQLSLFFNEVLEKMKKKELKENKLIKQDKLFRLEKFKLINFLKLKDFRLLLNRIFNINLVHIKVELPPPPPMYKEFSKILNEANNLVKKNNAKLYFVYLNADPRMRANYEKSYKKILSIVKNLNIPIIDIYEEVISKHPDPDSLRPFRIFTHYNEEGYKLIAEAILNHFNYD